MLFRTIVVAVDFSPHSDDALAHATAIARTDDAELILAHCVPQLSLPAHGGPGPLQGYSAHYAEMIAKERTTRAQKLRALCDDVERRGLRVRPLLLPSDASSELARAAAEQDADLIVVGTRGATGLDRVLLGSVAEATVRRSSVPVFVARADSTPGEYRHIVVGTEFSDVCPWALALARAVACPDDTIDVVHAWTMPLLAGAAGLGASETMRDQLRADAHDACADWVHRYAPNDSRVRAVAVERPAVDALCERAEAFGADLVVVGSHGRSGLRRLVLGSTAEATVRHAPCSVLVAHAPDIHQPTHLKEINESSNAIADSPSH